MGVSSNLQVFLSEKDLKDDADPELDLLVRPAMEIHLEDQCQTSNPEGDHDLGSKYLSVQLKERDQQDLDEEHHQEQQRNNVILPVPAAPLGNLKVKIPSYQEAAVAAEEEKDDSSHGFKTPTSSGHKIPPMLQCPLAPTKPKSKPSTKRKDSSPRIALDLTQEIESLFDTPLPVDDLGTTGNYKKVKLFKES